MPCEGMKLAIQVPTGKLHIMGSSGQEPGRGDLLVQFEPADATGYPAGDGTPIMACNAAGEIFPLKLTVSRPPGKRSCNRSHRLLIADTLDFFRIYHSQLGLQF